MVLNPKFTETIKTTKTISHPSIRLKLSIIGTLLLETALMTIAIAFGLILLDIAANVLVHFLLGYSWAWEEAHAADWLLFSTLIVAPLVMPGGLAWMVLPDEYHRILRNKTQKS